MYLMINEQDLIKDLLQDNITSVNQINIANNDIEDNYDNLFKKVNQLSQKYSKNSIK